MATYRRPESWATEENHGMDFLGPVVLGNSLLDVVEYEWKDKANEEGGQEGGV